MNSCIILVNKPRGLSSNTCVNIVKHAVGAKKAGHLGTLDVEGEGLLPVTINKATTLFDYYLQKDKIYKTTFRFGETTDTLDLEGEVTEKNDKIVTEEEIIKVIPSMLGKVAQMPPAYSAKKIKGQKAYDLARAGKEVELKPKEIEIYSIKLLSKLKENEFAFEIHCSSGTYIRSICRDMATALSTYGVMLNILRTKCGDFVLDNAFTLDEIKAGNFKTVELDTLFNYEKIQLNQFETDRLLNGVWIERKESEGLYNAYFGEEYLGVVSQESGKIKFKFRFV